jgi:predicted TPR repeat methyltransferase
MIEQAKRHQVYDKFHNVDLLEALEATPEALYDVIAALDVFIYAGDLSRAVPDALRILRPGGQFIFSCEAALPGEADLVLRPSRRFAHQRSHVEALCREAGFATVSVEELELRYENFEPIGGFLVTATKGA